MQFLSIFGQFLSFPPKKKFSSGSHYSSQNAGMIANNFQFYTYFRFRQLNANRPLPRPHIHWGGGHPLPTPTPLGAIVKLQLEYYNLRCCVANNRRTRSQTRIGLVPSLILRLRPTRSYTIIAACLTLI